jgi:hypothetical protein
MSGRERGVSNYNNELLLEVIKMLKPVSTSDWQRVATRYAELKSDSVVRDGATIKRHFHEKMCNKGLKPTGSAATDKRGQAIRDAQKVLHSIMESVSTGIYGGKKQAREDTMSTVSSLVSPAAEESDDCDQDDDNNDGYDEVAEEYDGEVLEHPVDVVAPRAEKRARDDMLEDQCAKRRSVDGAIGSQNKTKSCRNAPHPRAKTAAVLSQLASSLEKRNTVSSNDIVMEMFRAQQQATQTMTSMMHTMMTFMMHSPAHGPHQLPPHYVTMSSPVLSRTDAFTADDDVASLLTMSKQK